MSEQERLDDALQVCLDALNTGVELERCIELFAELAEYLRPALEGAMAARAIGRPAVSYEAQQRSRTNLLAHTARLRKERRKTLWFGLPKLAAATLGVVILFFMGVGGLFVASANSLPGDTLYPFKRSVEALSLNIAPSSSLKRSLELSYEKRRQTEAERLIMLGRREEVTFEGIVQALDGDELIVDEISVLVPKDLEIGFQLAVGEVVEVRGEVQPDGWVLGEGIRMRAYQIQGTVERISADEWTISGRSIRVTPLTLIQPGIRAGDSVIALVRVDGELVAQAILRQGPVAEESSEADPDPTLEPQEPDQEDEDDGDAEFEQRELTGRLEERSGSRWVVAGQAMTITGETDIDDDIEVGDLVRARAVVTPEGDWLATDLDLREKADESAEETEEEVEEEYDSEQDQSEETGAREEPDDESESVDSEGDD